MPQCPLSSCATGHKQMGLRQSEQSLEVSTRADRVTVLCNSCCLYNSMSKKFCAERTCFLFQKVVVDCHESGGFHRGSGELLNGGGVHDLLQ